MNWKWLLGGVGVLGVLAYSARRPSAPEEPFESPEDTRPAVRRVPVWDEHGEPALLPFVVKVELLVRGLEWPFVSMARLRRDAGAFSVRFVQQLREQCTGFPSFTGSPTVVVVEGGEGIFVTMTWAAAAWTPSDALTACIRRVLSADAELGTRLRRLSVHA